MVVIVLNVPYSGRVGDNQAMRACLNNHHLLNRRPSSKDLWVNLRLVRIIFKKVVSDESTERVFIVTILIHNYRVESCSGLLRL